MGVRFRLSNRTQTTPPRTPANFMKIPSHIGPNGISPVKYEDSESDNESDPIELATPPKVIKLDDSNIWAYNSPKQDVRNFTKEKDTTLDTDFDTLNSEYFDGAFDTATEVEKLRRQMYKVNRRLTKLEKQISDGDRNSKIRFYCGFVAIVSIISASFLYKKT